MEQVNLLEQDRGIMLCSVYAARVETEDAIGMNDSFVMHERTLP